MRELGELAKRGDDFARLGTRVIAICVDAPDALAELQAELGDAVTVVVDPEARAVRAFGMLDPAPTPDRVQARSGTFWIDAAGIVRHRWLPDSYRRRVEPETVLAALRG